MTWPPVFPNPPIGARNSQDQQTVDFINCAIEQAKEMQMHIRNVRIKAILGCATFAVAVSGFLFNMKYQISALFLFNILCAICLYIDHGHRNLLYQWISIRSNLQNYFLHAAENGIFDFSIIKNIINSPETDIKRDYATNAITAFFLSIFITSSFILKDHEFVQSIISSVSYFFDELPYFFQKDYCIRVFCEI